MLIANDYCIQETLFPPLPLELVEEKPAKSDLELEIQTKDTTTWVIFRKHHKAGDVLLRMKDKYGCTCESVAEETRQCHGDDKQHLHLNWYT